MDTPPDEGNDLDLQLAALDTNFSLSLPGRLKEISEGCRRLLDGAAAPAELESLGLHVHKLAGSGTTFGSPEISVAALALEGSIKRAMAGRRADREEILAELSALDTAIGRRLSGHRARPGGDTPSSRGIL